MKMMVFKGTTVVLAVITGAALTVFGMSEGWAQEKHKISYKLSADISKYTQQHVIDVGDVPGHQVRINEIHRTYPKDLVTFQGVRAVEEWDRGYSDYTDTNGRAWGYGIYFLENGDKIFTRLDGTSQTLVNPDGSKKSTYTGVWTLTGGTGKFRGIRGMLRVTIIFDTKAGLNEGQVEGEYWMED
ncbi:MAG TPA: hypothetical protein VMH26_00290 [Burkholderiales bacterium]|nr:hypothetical protein [Burkholderiales bacterium]